MSRDGYFRLNPHWTSAAYQAMQYAISYSRRYVEQRDHDIAGAALNVLIGINAAYVEAKGRTFYAQPPLLNDPRSSDSFINTALEHLRQNVQIALLRKDERAIEQSLRAMLALVRLYLKIDYSME